MAKLLYQGHGSLRLITDSGKVIYIDPFAGEGYDVPADLILVTTSTTTIIASIYRPRIRDTEYGKILMP